MNIKGRKDGNQTGARLVDGVRIKQMFVEIRNSGEQDGVE